MLTLTKNTAYKAGSVNQVRNQDGTYRAMTQAEYLTKLNAEVHINELAQISKKIKKPNVPDSKNHSFAKNGFSYRTAYFQDYDGEYYKITLSVGENGNISTVYNVGKLKKDTLPNGTIKSVFSGSKADSVSNGITVTQKSPSVNSILSENPKKITTESKRIAENSGVKRQNKISVEMNDAERAEVLRNSAIDIVKYKGNVEDLNAANVLALQETYRANAAPVLKKLAEKFGVFDKTYFNKNISLDFSYSRSSLKESVNKQGKVSTDFYDFAKMLYVFDDVVNNAVPIEAHTDKYAGTERANQNLKYDYVLLSAFSDGDYTIPVEMHIKEFSNKDPNKLYVSVTLGKIKTEDGILAHPSERKNAPANVTPPSSKINVAQLISKVNPGFADFYKYIPSELLTEAQIASKTVALEDEKYRLGVLRGEDVSGMLRKKAEKAGYSPDDSWKMDHRAPNADDDTAHNMAEIDAAYGGDGSIYSAQAAYYYGEGRSYDRNAIRVIQSARNNPEKKITVYRAVPSGLKETSLRNGDWVAIVKQYAIEHGNRVLDGNFKIIQMTVPAKYLYGNGDSINEWGYDNGNRNEVYKNTANNVKTLEVTYDNSGELIPLSKRYDERKKDIRFQRKLPDVQEKLKKMSGSDDIDDVKRMAYGLADDFMKYAKAARLEMTETRGLMPQSTRVSEIVAKYNDYKKTGISNKQLESDITDIFTDYMNGVGSSGTLFNYITDTIMKRELNSYEVIGDETFKAVRAYTDGGRFKVSDATVGSLVDTFGSLGEINGILRENYGFTIAKETDARAENRAVWAPVGAQLAEEAGHVFDGTDYSYTSKYTTENGYVTSRKVNQCESCEGCPYRNECHTSKYDRRNRVSHKLTEQNQKATELITTDEGILLRMNRFIQVGCRREIQNRISPKKMSIPKKPHRLSSKTKNTHATSKTTSFFLPPKITRRIFALSPR